MKTYFISLFLLVCLTSFAQDKNPRNPQLANLKRDRESVSPEELARHITANAHTEMEKVRSIFTWVADNISYNVRPRYNTLYPALGPSDDANDTTALKPLSERVAEGVLRRGVAFCDGYARLFQTLCGYAGIQCELISGYARTGNSKRAQQTFRSNHRWNAVMIDSTWRLVDVTWSSGYVSGSNEFVRYFDDRYFLSRPEDFIRDHYPEDVQWTLLPSPPTFNEYISKPFWR